MIKFRPCFLLLSFLLSGCEGYSIITPANTTTNGNNGSSSQAPAAECLQTAQPGSNGFQTGDGSPGDPYTICTAAQLNSIQDNYLDKDFKLISNIDMNGINYNIIGSNELIAMGSYKRYSGTFDGNNYEITNLTVNNSVSDTYGFIGGLDSSGVIKNLKIVNSNVDDSASVGFGPYIVGGMAGVSYGRIENCEFHGLVTNNLFGGSAGGIVGISGENSRILKSVFKGDAKSATGKAAGITAYADQVVIMDSSFIGNVRADRLAGGIIAELYSNINTTTLSNNYAEGDIFSYSYQAGGLIGNIYADSSLNINKSYHKGEVSGETSAGGLFGYIEEGSADQINIENIYHIGDIISAAGSAGGVAGIVASNFRINATYTVGVITAATYTGGIFGEGVSYVPLSNKQLVWNSLLSYAIDPIGDAPGAVTGISDLSSDQMKFEPSYSAGFDFGSVWEINPSVNDGYPSLR